MKGQISIDFIIILIVAVIAISATSVFALDFQEATEEIVLENQLERVSFKLANFITASQIMSDTEFEAKLKIPNINYNGKSYAPEIIITNTAEAKYLTLSTDFITREFNSNFSVTQNQVVTIEDGFLVITNGAISG
jgi:hypothetical protein